MTLNDCTKAELLTIIEHLKRHLLGSGDYHVKQALLEIEGHRNLAKLEKADKIADLAAQKRQEYIDLLSPYDGKSFGEIPFPVLSKAREAMVAAQKYDEEWNKLMDINC